MSIELALTASRGRCEEVEVPTLAEGAMLKNNPMVKKLVQTGEERVGKLASTLLSNENFVAAVQSLVSKSLAAKGTRGQELALSFGGDESAFHCGRGISARQG